ncbi:PH domain-containing protein [Streptomyces tsukubensis]|uniref:PH domain-containing protein n=1 Tax=Streptomyces tsukubensis TaxID=83656 RepID=UPI00344C1DCA
MVHGIQPEQPFTLGDVELTRHPERSIRVNRIAAALSVLGVTALLGALGATVTSAIYLLLTRSRDWHDMLDWWDVRMALAVLLPAAFYIWRWNRIRAAWTFRGYHLGAEELYIRRGLLNRKLSVLAYARIQEVNVSSGPIQRRYRLATVTISSAAGREAVEDVDPQTAHDLRDRLTELARERRLPV